MRILFLGDYSGFHSTLAAQLRKAGHECTVVSDGSRCMDTSRDIDLTRKQGKLGAIKYLFDVNSVVSRLKGYDVVQLINPSFFTLRPEKLKFFFDRIRKNNSSVFLTLASSDSLIVDSLLNTQTLRYSEFKVGDNPTNYTLNNQKTINRWLSKELTDYCKYVYDKVDGAASALYEYHLAATPHLKNKPLVYSGIPVDTNTINFLTPDFSIKNKIKLLVGIKSELIEFKGTNRLLDVAKEIEAKYPDRCEVVVAKDLKINDYLISLLDADIVLDQLYSYTPATNALQTMAMGKISVSGAEPEFYDFIDEKELKPIINVVPDDKKIFETLETLVNQPAEVLNKLALDGRKFVEKHNSAEIVADRFLELWGKIQK